jgi:hypothetical protein
MEVKFRELKAAADCIGMIINCGKTQYICVNSADVQPFRVDNLIISHVESYVYLGTPISAAPITDQLKQHLKQKTCHILKFYSFLTKNHDAPFQVKKKVWDSALKAAIFYSCETWLAKDIRPAETIYNATLKSLLGVRSTTCNDIVFIESGEYGAKAYIRHLQATFLHRLLARDDYRGSYLEFVINLAITTRCPAGLLLHDLVNEHQSQKELHCVSVQQAVLSSDSTRRVAYRNLNPTLSVSQAYTSSSIPECNRIAFTRLRLSSHHLQYEMGRWTRVPPEQRLCRCGAVQTDSHVLLECVHTQQARLTNNITNCTNLSDLYDNFDIIFISQLCKDVLDVEL